MSITVCVAPSHSTLTPKQSETNLTGTSVLPFKIFAGTSSVIGCPFLYAVVLFIVRDMLISPLVAVTVCVSPFHSTSAPIFSNIALKGTNVLPFSIIGNWSKLITPLLYYKI